MHSGNDLSLVFVVGLLLIAAGACGDAEGSAANMNADGLRHVQQLSLDGVVSFAADESTLVFSGRAASPTQYTEQAFDFNTGEAFEKRGSILVYERNGDLWRQAELLTHLVPAEGFAQLGERLAVYANTILASNGRNIVIFEKVDGIWVFGQEIQSECEHQLAVRGDVAVAASNCRPQNPTVEVFRRTASGWSKAQEIIASQDPRTRISDVAFDGETIVIGFEYAELVFVFEQKNGEFEETQALERDPALDPEFFGFAVEVSGDRIAIGAPGTRRDGRVYIYERRGPAWVRAAMPDPLNFLDVLEWGSALALRGTRLLVGAPFERTRQGGINQTPDPRRTTESPEYGAAYLFEEIGGRWEQRYYIKSAGPERYEQFGGAIALTGAQVFAGTFSATTGAYVQIWTQEEAP